MSFKQEFLTALHSGEADRTLMEIVRRHFRGHESGREAYEALEELWRDLGFEESDEASALRNELEFVMERVWYYGANAS